MLYAPFSSNNSKLQTHLKEEDYIQFINEWRGNAFQQTGGDVSQCAINSLFYASSACVSNGSQTNRRLCQRSYSPKCQHSGLSLYYQNCLEKKDIGLATCTANRSQNACNTPRVLPEGVIEVDRYCNSGAWVLAWLTTAANSQVGKIVHSGYRIYNSCCIDELCS